jgi:hypothetical protein
MGNRARTRVTNLFAGLAAVALLTASPVGAGEENAGTYGAPSLRIPVGAKLMSSPDVLAGMEPDASLLFSNPAFTSAIPAPQVFLSTSNWLDDMRLSAVSVAVPTGHWGLSVATGATLLYSGGLKGYDAALNVVAEEDYYDMAATGAVVKRFDSAGLSLSLGGTYIRQHLYPTDGSGVAFTAGAVYERGANTLHLVARNVGGAVQFADAEYDIDSEKIAGYGRSFEAGLGTVMAGVQMVYASAAPSRLELGAGYRFNRLLTVRTSVRDVLDSQSEGFALDAGFSVRYNQVALDYAYTSHAYFAGTHTFSVAFTFRGADGGAGPMFDTDETGGDAAARARTSRAPAKSPADRGATITVVPRATPPAAEKPAAATVYLLVTGTYSWENGARDEVRALELQGIDATVERGEKRYLVVLGRYEERRKANAELRKLETTGIGGRIVAIGP